MTALALYSRRVLLDSGLRDATIFIRDGIIDTIVEGLVEQSDMAVINHGRDVIMPGLIDPHVHVNEPGRTHWEGFDSATRAAAAGGITTLMDMPLNSTPVTTNARALRQKRAASEGQMQVHCGFWGGLIPESLGDLSELLSTGILGVKAFLIHSGIDEFPCVSEDDLRRAMPILKSATSTLLVHCELAQHLDPKALSSDPKSYRAYLSSRPAASEDAAIDLMIRLCKTYNVAVHIVHVSSASAIPKIAQAKAEGHLITSETCPHYLYFEAEAIEDGSVLHKCAPPIRERVNNEQLWRALETGVIDFIASDHSPAPPTIKAMHAGNFSEAWGGIAGLQFSLPAIWTRAGKRGWSIGELSERMSYRPAHFLGLGRRKGRIAVGYDADLVVWDPESDFVVEPSSIHHRHKITPYLRERLSGIVRQTYVDGHCVFDNGTFSAISKGREIRL